MSATWLVNSSQFYTSNFLWVWVANLPVPTVFPRVPFSLLDVTPSNLASIYWPSDFYWQEMLLYSSQEIIPTHHLPTALLRCHLWKVPVVVSSYSDTLPSLRHRKHECLGFWHAVPVAANGCFVWLPLNAQSLKAGTPTMCPYAFSNCSMLCTH